MLLDPADDGDVGHVALVRRILGVAGYRTRQHKQQGNRGEDVLFHFASHLSAGFRLPCLT